MNFVVNKKVRQSAFTGKMHVAKHYDYLVGRIAKVTALGVVLEKEYEALFGFGNWQKAEFNHWACHMGGRYEMSLMFIDEEPHEVKGIVWYCLKEVGIGVSGDWHWYTLNQLMICEE